MQRIVIVTFVFFSVLFSNTLFGQTAERNSTTTPTYSNSNLLNLDSEDWSFFIDEENQIYYIDFETIKTNLSDVIVKDESGKVILKDDVMNLPVNTIYEIDFSQYGTGNYAIELRSFKGSFEKEVKIK